MEYDEFECESCGMIISEENIKYNEQGDILCKYCK